MKLFHRQLFDFLDSPSLKPDAVALVAGLKNDGIVLECNDPADNAADGGNAVTDLQSTAHILQLLVLLLLRTDHEKIHDENYESKRQDQRDQAPDSICGSCISCRASCQ